MHLSVVVSVPKRNYLCDRPQPTIKPQCHLGVYKARAARKPSDRRKVSTFRALLSLPRRVAANAPANLYESTTRQAAGNKRIRWMQP